MGTNNIRKAIIFSAFVIFALGILVVHRWIFDFRERETVTAPDISNKYTDEEYRQQRNELSQLKDVVKRYQQQGDELSRLQDLVKQYQKQGDELSRLQDLVKQYQKQGDELSRLQEVVKQYQQQGHELSRLQDLVKQYQQQGDDLSRLQDLVKQYQTQRNELSRPQDAVKQSQQQRNRLSGQQDVDNHYQHQRNELSRLLNSVKQELAIVSCEKISLQQNIQSSLIVSVSGGWCRNASRSDSGHHFFDKQLALSLSDFLQNASVASFGDGPGDYKKTIDSTHRIRIYDAYDGAPYGPETSGGAVKFLDLTAPQYGLPVYDWVLSLEVAEHIPPKFEDIYIDNIVRHAGTGIILSWAEPNQGGLSHVNERPLSYSQNIFSAKGFECDQNASVLLRNSSSLDWLKRNIFVYRRQNGSIILPENA